MNNGVGISGRLGTRDKGRVDKEIGFLLIIAPHNL